jgi:hypothetical protein
MDLSDAIQKLYAEKESLLRAIAALEALQQESRSGSAAAQRSRRGRKSMDSEERQEVSLRMKKYWASRRSSAETAPSPIRTARETTT